MSRPPNCRIFLGNLASERTSREELFEVFSKYGNIVEEIVIRKSFGFIQYDNPESAQRAIQEENGRVIGGIRVDLNLADNREPKNKKSKGSDRAQSPQSGKRRKRSSSPRPKSSMESRSLKRQTNAQSGTSLPLLSQVLYLTPGQKNYAEKVEQMILTEVGGFATETLLIERRLLNEMLKKAEKRGLRYVCTIQRQNEQTNTVNLYLFRPMARPEVYENVPLQDVLNLMRQQENLIRSFLNPGDLSSGLQQIPPGFQGLVSSGGFPFSSIQGMASGLSPFQSLPSSGVSGFSSFGSLPLRAPNQAPPSLLASQPISAADAAKILSPTGMPSQPGLFPQASTSPFLQNPSGLAVGAQPGAGTPSVNPLLNLLTPRNTEILQSLLAKITNQSPQPNQVTNTVSSSTSASLPFQSVPTVYSSPGVLPLKSDSASSSPEGLSLSANLLQLLKNKQNPAFQPSPGQQESLSFPGTEYSSSPALQDSSRSTFSNP